MRRVSSYGIDFVKWVEMGVVGVEVDNEGVEMGFRREEGEGTKALLAAVRLFDVMKSVSIRLLQTVQVVVLCDE